MEPGANSSVALDNSSERRNTVDRSRKGSVSWVRRASWWRSSSKRIPGLGSTKIPESAPSGATHIAEPQLALTALQEIKEKAKEADVELKDAVSAFMTRDGRIKIKQGWNFITGTVA